MSNAVEKIKIYGDKVRIAMKSIRQDAWFNPFTGLGTARDKATATAFEADDRLSDDDLENLYNGDDMAAAIADIVPDEMLRQGYDVKIETSAETAEDLEVEASKAAEMEKAIKDAAKDLEVQNKFIEVMTWARVFGGSALLLGCDDGARDQGLAEPLDENKITKFDHINVLDKRFMVPNQWYTDPTMPKFGYPKTYIVTPEAVPVASIAQIKLAIENERNTTFAGAVEVHESRMIIFGGTRTTTRERQRNNGWHRSVLQRVHTVLRQYGIGWSALTHILQDANQAVFKMDGLIDALASRDFDVIQARLELVDMSRSVARSVILDRETEEFERQNFTWSGIEKPFEMLMLRLSAAARMPVTILMAQSPAGMDATGESDIRWFYDTIATKRENDLDPKLSRVHKLIMLAKNGPTNGKEPENWSLTYPSLWQMTPKEEAEVRKMQAEADKIYMEFAAVLPEEIALSRFTPDGWKAETTIDTETRVHMLESEKESALNPSEPAPEPTEPVPDEKEDQKDSTEVQSLVFSKNKFTAEQAKDWAQKHKKHFGKVDITEDTIRLRQIDPGRFIEGSFRTITLTEGVKAVIGRLKK